MENPGYDGNEDIPDPREPNDDSNDPNKHMPPIGKGGGTSSRIPTIPEEIPGSKVTRLSNELKRQKIHALHEFLGVGGMLT